MEVIRKIKKSIKSLLVKPQRVEQPVRRIEPDSYPICNINQDVLNPHQPRLAFVYIKRAWDVPTDEAEIYHPNILHQAAMIQILCRMGYVIDFYSCYHYPIEIPAEAYANRYDVIFGFGPQYIQLCAANPQAKKILFITENAPWVVRERYMERVEYFRKRHPDVAIQDSPRTDFYTDEMFEISDAGIAVTGSHNLSSIQQRLPRTIRMNVNGLQNPKFDIHATKLYKETRTHFVWFGSRGFIHKGLDILMDAFAELPQLTLDVYGIDDAEMASFPIPQNVHLCGMVNVMSEEFVNKVVLQNSFVISLSCSEGMQTGLVTCMMHGLIPIVTKECGIDDQKDVLFFDGYDLESVKATLLRASQITERKVHDLEQKIYTSAIGEFTTATFAREFEKRMKELMNEGMKE